MGLLQVPDTAEARNYVGAWWCSAPRSSNADWVAAEDHTTLGGHLPTAARTSNHYSLTVLLNGCKKVAACYDSGAATCMISLGLVRACHIPYTAISEGDQGTFTSADGSSSSFAGKLHNVVLTLHPEFELTLSYVWVSNSLEHLFLVGNDLFRHHATFSFKGLTYDSATCAHVVLRDHHRKIVVEVPCV